MEQVKTPSLGTSIFVVQGITGFGLEKTCWTHAAYSSNEYAEKARKLLQKMADAVANEEGSGDVELRALKEIDPKAYFDEIILYTVEEVRYVC